MPQILLVEDDPMNQAVAQGMLNILYPEVEMVIAEDGGEALEILSRREFDLILSDIQMPGIDGYEFVRRAREELKITVPIISVTAYAIVGDREKLLLHGFDDYVSKPIILDQLKQILGKHLAEEVS